MSNRRLSADYNVLALDAASVAEGVQPGQFVMVKTVRAVCAGVPLLRRPFSVFEILRDGDRVVGLSLLSKRVGITTQQLFDARPGDRISCLGPLGLPFRPVEPPQEAWMVAGGVGLAPFVTLAEALHACGTTARLYYGGRSADDLFYLDAFERLGVSVRLATEDGSRGAHGRITVPLDRDLRAEGSQAVVYACGPEGMLAAVSRLAGAVDRPVHVSVERVMGCGLGGCYSCVVPVRDQAGARAHFVRSCLSGPVFDGHTIDWNAPH